MKARSAFLALLSSVRAGVLWVGARWVGRRFLSFVFILFSMNLVDDRPRSGPIMVADKIRYEGRRPS